MTKSALKGQLSTWTMPTLLRELRGEKRTGLLSFELGDAKRALRFRDGQVIAAFTNVENEKLPARLLALGLVDETDLQQALTIMRRDAKALAEVLEARGLVDRAGLERAFAEQIRDILARALGGESGTYVFDLKATPAGEESGLDIVTEDLVLEAVRQITDPAVVRYALGETDRTLVLSRGLRLERLRLTASDGYFLSRVDGTLTGREVMEMLPLESEESRRTLLALLCAGIVEFQGPTRVAFKLPDIATRAAERALELGIAPPPPPTPVPAPTPPAAGPIPPLPLVPVVVTTLEDEVAEETVAKAERELFEERPAEAARLLESVVDLVGGDLRRRVRRLLAEALLADPRSEKRGESQLHILVAEAPDDVEAYFLLGNVYRQRGLRSRADAMFRRVLDLEPGHEGASAALGPPPAVPKPAPSGLLGRLLGRE
jgi:tetratricopeptide (TPR) repeat protein